MLISPHKKWDKSDINCKFQNICKDFSTEFCLNVCVKQNSQLEDYYLKSLSTFFNKELYIKRQYTHLKS